MNLYYKNKKTIDEILAHNDYFQIISNDYEHKNKLILGDNFQILKCLLYDFNLGDKINLIYIDPPFSTNNKFMISEERANTISSSYSDDVAYSDNLKGSEYLEFIRERLILLRELLSRKGSIYLHIDYKIGHYIKIIMDEIFGPENFRNDITRIKCNPKNFYRKAFGNIKDLILFYSKSKEYIWNEPKIMLNKEDIYKLFKKTDKSGRKYTTIPIHAPGETKNGDTANLFRGLKPPKGRHWRTNVNELEKLDKEGLIEWSSNNVPRKIVYADEIIEKGKKMQDIWEFKDPQYPIYPTQKNQEMLKLIIETSSNEGDLILDCFAGGGTTLLAAQELNRNWIGIDNSPQAIRIIKEQFSKLPINLFESKIPFQYFELLHKKTKVV